MDLWQSDEEFTHVEEGAGMLQDKLTGVWLVLTVIHVNVELVSLENRRGGGENSFTWSFLLCHIQAHPL